LLIYSSIAVSFFLFFFFNFSNQDMSGNKDHGLTHKMVEGLDRLPVIEALFLTITYLFLHCSELVFLSQNQVFNGNKECGMTHEMKKDLNCTPEARKLSSQRVEGNQLPLGCLSPASNAWLTLPSAIALHLSSPPSPPPAHTGIVRFVELISL